MSIVENVVNAAPEEDQGVVSSLSDIKARLQKRRERDLTKLPKFTHEALGTVHIGFLPADGYHAIEAANMMRDEFGIGTDHAWSMDDIKKFQDDKRDRAYLKYGVITGDNKRIDDEIVNLLLSGDYGAENRKLINAIQKQNPPREMLADELRVAFSFDGAACVLLRILSRAGMLDKAAGYLAADDGSAESKALGEELKVWEKSLPVWELMLEAEDVAARMGIDVYNRMKAEESEPTE